MQIPFERLMELVAALSESDRQLTLGALSERWDEPAARIGDAVDAVRVLNGERTYVSIGPVCPKCGNRSCLADKALNF